MSSRGLLCEAISIGQLEVVDSPKVLVCRALGSCIGLMVYDETERIGGLAHILLPKAPGRDSNDMPAKFADEAIPLMLKRIEELGGKASHCRAKLVGGARMFFGGKDPTLNIGVRNTEAVRALLKACKVPIVAEDTGGDYARTVEFDTRDFQAVIKSLAHEEKRM